jgi:hypothetical protein
MFTQTYHVAPPTLTVPNDLHALLSAKPFRPRPCRFEDHGTCFRLMAGNLGDANGRQISPGTISTGFKAPASLMAFHYSCSLSCLAEERKPSVKRNLTEHDLIDKFEMSYGAAGFWEACGLFLV